MLVRTFWYVFLVGLCVCIQQSAQAVDAPSSLRFSSEDIWQVRMQPFFKSVEGLGTIESRRRATLSATLSAPLMYINRQVGQSVTQGTLLARLDDELLQRQLASQKASDRSALLQLSKDHRHFENGLRLYTHHFLSKTAFQDLLSQYQASDAAVSVIEAAIHQTELNIARTRVTAPFDGVISAAPGELGQTMNTGQAIISMVDPRSFQAKIQLPVSALAEIHLGDEVTFDYPRGLGHAVGTISFIAPQLTGQSQTLVVYSDLPHNARFLPEGLFLKAYVRTHVENKALLIPMTALHDGSAGPYVYLVTSNQRVRIVPVKTGLSYGGQVDVRQGLAVGDRIVARDLGPLSANQLVSIDH